MLHHPKARATLPPPPLTDPVWDFIIARHGIDAHARELLADREALHGLRGSGESRSGNLQTLWILLERRARPFVLRSVWKVVELPEDEEFEYHFHPERTGNRFQFWFSAEVPDASREELTECLLANAGVQAYCGLDPGAPTREWTDANRLVLGN